MELDPYTLHPKSYWNVTCTTHLHDLAIWCINVPVKSAEKAISTCRLWWGGMDTLSIDRAFVKIRKLLQLKKMNTLFFWNIPAEASGRSLWGNSLTSCWEDEWCEDCDDTETLARLKSGSQICIRALENLKIHADSSGTIPDFPQWREKKKAGAGGTELPHHWYH